MQQQQQPAETALNFVRVCVHAYLHARRVYPDDMFEEQQTLGLVTFVSRDPSLSSYVDESLKRSLGWLAEGRLKCISARLIRADCDKLVEKLDFEFIPGEAAVVPSHELYRACLVQLSRLRLPVLPAAPVKFVLLFLADHAQSRSLERDWIVADLAGEDVSGEEKTILPLITTDGPISVCVRVDSVG